MARGEEKKKKNYVCYTPEQLAAVPGPEQREQEQKGNPVGGLATGAAIGAVAGSILGINPVAGAALGGAAGVAREARKGSGK